MEGQLPPQGMPLHTFLALQLSSTPILDSSLGSHAGPVVHVSSVSLCSLPAHLLEPGA